MMTVVETQIQPLGGGNGGGGASSALSSGVGAAPSWNLFHSSATPSSSIYNDMIFIGNQPTTSLGGAASPLMTSSFPLLGSSLVSTSFPTTPTMTTSFSTSCAAGPSMFTSHPSNVGCSSSSVAALSTASTAPSTRALSSAATSASSLGTGWTPDTLDEEEEDDDEEMKPKFRRATMGVEDPARAADNLERCERRRSELRKTVSFSQISVREFQRTMAPENAPSTRRGLPLTLDWKYVDQESLTVDDYEAKRPKRRRNNELVMRTRKLMSLVLEFCSDMTERDVLRRMKEAAKAEKKMKQQGDAVAANKALSATKTAQEKHDEDDNKKDGDDDGKTQVTEQTKRFSKRFDKVIVLSSPPTPASTLPATEEA